MYIQMLLSISCELTYIILIEDNQIYINRAFKEIIIIITFDIYKEKPWLYGVLFCEVKSEDQNNRMLYSWNLSEVNVLYMYFRVWQFKKKLLRFQECLNCP